MADPLVVFQPANDCGDPENKFGRALATVGSRLLVGAPGEVCGYAHLIDGRTGEAVLTLQSPVNLEANGFGTAVAALGRNLLVSAPREEAVYLFDGRTGALRQTFQNPSGPFEEFGASVVGVDRQRVAVGAPAAGDGVVYVFDVATGTVLSTVTNPTPGTGRQFGRSLAMAGRSLVVGAPIDPFPPTSSAGGAFLVDPDTGAATPLVSGSSAPGARFGAAVAATGRRILVGAPGTSSAWVFDRHGTLIRELDHSDGTLSEAFGASAAIRGSRAVLGAPFFDAGDDQGGAFLFSLGSGLIRDQVFGFGYQDAAGTSVALLRKAYAVGAPTQGAGYVLIVR